MPLVAGWGIECKKSCAFPLPLNRLRGPSFTHETRLLAFGEFRKILSSLLKGCYWIAPPYLLLRPPYLLLRPRDMMDG